MRIIKYLLPVILTGLLNYSFAQSSDLQHWQLLDPDSGNYIGTATSTAYSTLLKGKTSTPIIVAVMDGGTDTTHPDLKANLWINEKEIPGNGIDDDHNGYADDIHGWNFIGGKNGTVEHDNIEVTRLYKLGKEKLPAQYSWKKIKKSYKIERKNAHKEITVIGQLYDMLSDVKKNSKHDPPTAEDMDNYLAHGIKMKVIKKAFVSAMKRGADFNEFYGTLQEAKEELDNTINFHLNPDYDSRNIVGDNYADLSEKYYGNNDVTGPTALHGTHVAGIIAAIRNNNSGMDGIADNVKIMIVRVVPDGDERDKDVANGIHYAVDNGAKIINMSFGKNYSPDKQKVDEAIQYAADHGVLIVHGAGNESANNDVMISYPNQLLGTDKRAINWIEVGATDQKGHAANFSNYGKQNVDVFAPGVGIYSTVTNGEYKMEDGTSMACPVVSGIAALVWSYYPQLTMVQLRTALLNGVRKQYTPTMLPGSRKTAVQFDTLSVTGGIINAENALKQAAEMVK